MTESSAVKHTKIPNDLLDKHMADMGVAELKVVLFAMRQTLGYHRASDGISLSQFMAATGLSRQGVLDGIENAKKRRVLCEAGRGKRGVVVYRIDVESLQEPPVTSQASRPVERVDQSSEATSTSQASRPDEPATSQASRHTKDKEIKENFERKESVSHSPEPTPVPFHIQNGLGRQKPNEPSPIIRAIEASPVYQAYVRGWDGITPVLNRNVAQLTYDAVHILEGDVENGETTFAEVEAVTRWKRTDPRTRDYPIGFVKVDTQSYRAWKRAQDNAASRPPARAAPNGNGAHAPPSTVPAAAPSTSEGFAGLKRRVAQAKQGGG